MKPCVIKTVAFFILMAFAIKAYCQTKIDYSGEYIYKNERYFESILLKTDGQFIFNHSEEFKKERVTGNWQLRNNAIILDSHPQRDKLIVYESFKEGLKNKYVHVYNKSHELIHYSLYYITNTEDTISLTNQWKYSKLKATAKSFFIVDGSGLTSPIYKVQGSKANFFDVLLETHRVFENEYWIIQDNQIIPLTTSGRLQSYKLFRL